MKLNTNIPFESFKKGVSAMLGKEIAEYFLEEYGDRIGIQDQTKPFDVTKPEIQDFLPGIQAIKNRSGPVYVKNNPYLLLLSLDLENRKYATHFFNEAMNKKMYPIIFDRISYSNLSPPSDYVFTDNRISEFTENPHIITFENLLKIGKTYNIKGIAAYGDRLKKFSEQLKQIPRT